MYAIINLHWQLTLGSAAVRETDPLAEPPLFADAGIHYSKNIKKDTTIFFIRRLNKALAVRYYLISILYDKYF